MIRAIKPVKLSLYLLLSLAVVLYSGQSPLAVIPAFFFFLAFNAFESFSRADFDKLHRRNHLSSEKRILTFRVAIFSATLAILTSFYFSLALWYVFLVILTVVASNIVVDFYFLSDLLLSMVPTLLYLAHAGNSVAIIPFFWFVFFNEFAQRILSEINKPFGLENNNLPKLVGTESAISFAKFIVLFALFWPILLGKFSNLLAYLVYASSSFLVVSALYSVDISQYKHALKFLRVSYWLFVSAFFVSLLF